MAQVLAPIHQSSSSLNMLHSSSDAFQTPSTQPHPSQQRSSQMPRNPAYNSHAGGSGYRGTSAPIAPYAFSSTPQLRQDLRVNPIPQQPPQQQAQPAFANRLGHPTHLSSSSDSTVSLSGSSSRSAPSVTKDDIDINKSAADRASLTLSTAVPDLSLPFSETAVRPSPGRYRRAPGRADSSNSQNTISPPTVQTQLGPSAGTSLSTEHPRSSNASSQDGSQSVVLAIAGHSRSNSATDTQVLRPGSVDQAKRYRRRSLSGLDAGAVSAKPTLLESGLSTASTPTVPGSQEFRPSSSQGHERQGSSGSASSNASRPNSRHESVPQRAVAPVASATSHKSVEPTRRMAPSPLSQPMSPSEPPSPARKAEPTVPSPAMRQLSALNDKDGNKGVKSRLRRAFSFGSAAELRRASAENNLSAERAKLRKERYQNEEDAEEAAIVAKQEAAGIGAGIYSGQGGFSGSTDNLSISSTASSASIMLRKMGHGMKKGGKSIKGLFRPKSVIGVPAADGPVQPSMAEVSRVTVEAERQKVNVNLNPHDQAGGGTGYPRLERNSLDASRSTEGVMTSLNESNARKSIVGGERERAEILSSIKKGILKRNGTSSPSSSPVVRPVDASETPKSSAPSTPTLDHNQDYFARPPRLANPSTRSLPNTPHGSLRNISFSPRIQFHDAWSPADYDRRGDIATCNRLTPMLAQQIKEELNSFKMEMEVHELSKPHTHFF